MSAHRTRTRLIRRVFPLMDAVGDDFHRRYCRVAQAGVTGDLTADAFALVAHHVAHAFQLANDPVDFLHESPATRRTTAFRSSAAGPLAEAAWIRCWRRNAMWSASLSVSGARRAGGAYFSGPGFSGPSLSVPSRSMAAIVLLLPTQRNVALTLPSRIDCRM